MKKSILILVTLLFIPQFALALEMPDSGSDLANLAGIKAQAYIVTDASTGEILISKNADKKLIPASLTKIVTALVVLDTKPKLSKSVTMTKEDEVVGMCKNRGVCIKSKAGVKFTVDGLFHAAILLSANNATNALARSTGLSKKEFAARMNKKAKELGATSSYFYEPTGLESKNVITASDYAKIITAAFSNEYLREIAAKPFYAMISSNNSKYNQIVKNGDKLLGDEDLQVLGAKTGYLDESKYNFSVVMKYRNGREMAIVVLGEDHLYEAFEETKTLAKLGEVSRILAALNPLSTVLGTSTIFTLN